MSSSAYSLASLVVVFIISCFLLEHSNGFAPQPFVPPPHTKSTYSSSSLASSTTDDISFVDNITQRYQLFQKSRAEGYDFKQSTAIAIAGEYDEDSVQKKIQEEISSAPVVMFTWEASPACKKAIKYLDIAGASYKVVRLDNPWQEGNPIRAELGKMNRRSSVPAIFIGGQYVGGFDAGNEKSPGILEMAFKGTLQERLKEVGAL